MTTPADFKIARLLGFPTYQDAKMFTLGLTARF
jgi:hypothetical protein